MKAKKIETHVTVTEPAQVLAVAVSLVGKLYTADRDRVLRALVAYFAA